MDRKSRHSRRWITSTNPLEGVPLSVVRALGPTGRRVAPHNDGGLAAKEKAKSFRYNPDAPLNKQQAMMALKWRERSAEAVKTRKSKSKLLGRAWLAAASAVRALRARRYVFQHDAAAMRVYTGVVSLFALYSAVYVPLVLALPELRWRGDEVLDGLITALFMGDIVVRARTSVSTGGEVVVVARTLWRIYARSWLAVDLVAAVPWYLSGAPELRLLQLLRLCKLALLNVKPMKGLGNVLRIVRMMAIYTLCAHWVGLAWYVIAVRPLVDGAAAADAAAAGPYLGLPWLWEVAAEEGGAFPAGDLYICSLYWAFSVMSALKGLPAHESRQCLVASPYVPRPMAERAYTLCAFLAGAMIYACIFGNVSQVIQSIDATGSRYRSQVENMNEFLRTHAMPTALQRRVRKHVEASFSESKGIDVRTIANQLPTHLQVEVYYHLNLSMLRRVDVLRSCHARFLQNLVTRLQFSLVACGEYASRAGEPLRGVSFVRRGILQVFDGSVVRSTLKDGDHFGEATLIGAVLGEQRIDARTDLVGVTDCMILNLTMADFAATLELFPHTQMLLASVAGRARTDAHRGRRRNSVPAGRAPAGRARTDAHRRNSVPACGITAPDGQAKEEAAASLRRCPSIEGLLRRPSVDGGRRPSIEGLLRRPSVEGGRRPSCPGAMPRPEFPTWTSCAQTQPWSLRNPSPPPRGRRDSSGGEGVEELDDVASRASGASPEVGVRSGALGWREGGKPSAPPSSSALHPPAGVRGGGQLLAPPLDGAPAAAGTPPSRLPESSHHILAGVGAGWSSDVRLESGCAVESFRSTTAASPPALRAAAQGSGGAGPLSAGAPRGGVPGPRCGGAAEDEGENLGVKIDALGRMLSMQIQELRAEMRSTLRDVEQRQRLVLETARQEDRKLLAEVTTQGSTLAQQLRVFPFMKES